MATTNHCATDLTQVPGILGTPNDVQHSATGEVNASVFGVTDQNNRVSKVLSKLTALSATSRRSVTALEARWKWAGECIRAASKQLRERAGHPQGDIAFFANNQTLIQTALKEV